MKLRAGRESTIHLHHPWIFSGAIDHAPPDAGHGSIIQVADSSNQILGTGTYSAHSMIAVRVFDFADRVLDSDWFYERVTLANERRTILGFGAETDTGYRVIYGESDGLPGVVVDRYGDVLVIQLSTAGAETVKPFVVEALIKLFSPSSIIERSDLSVRREEKLSDQSGLLYGQEVCTVEFTHTGLCFLADVAKGQKTGFYLDQRELRRIVARLARGRRVLNLFSGAGSFAVAALKGGAVSVHNVDSSQPAVDMIGTNIRINVLESDACTSECADVFSWISSRNEPEYDMVIADPPALIKSHSDVDVGRKAYHFLNRAAMRLLRGGGIFVTSSCSSFFSEDDFAHTLRRASVQVGVELRTLEIARQSADHPISIYFPESYYLKSFVCQLNR